MLLWLFVRVVGLVVLLLLLLLLVLAVFLLLLLLLRPSLLLVLCGGRVGVGSNSGVGVGADVVACCVVDLVVLVVSS